MHRAAQMALVAGSSYLLGRRRKLRLALVLGGAVVVGRLSGNSGELLRRGAKAFGGPSGLSEMTGLGKPVIAATKAAATAAVSRRIDSVSEGLHDRAELLRNKGPGGEDNPASTRDRSGGDRAAAGGRPNQEEADAEQFGTDDERQEPESSRRGADGRRSRRQPEEVDDEDRIEDKDEDFDEAVPEDDKDRMQDKDDDFDEEEPEDDKDRMQDKDDDFDEEPDDQEEAAVAAPARSANRRATSTAAPVRRRGR
jgi:hypothetical protein